MLLEEPLLFYHLVLAFVRYRREQLLKMGIVVSSILKMRRRNGHGVANGEGTPTVVSVLTIRLENYCSNTLLEGGGQIVGGRPIRARESFTRVRKLIEAIIASRSKPPLPPLFHRNTSF